MNDQAVQLLANEIIEKSQSTDRYMVAIAGPPASGKSTLAQKLRLLINQQTKSDICEVIPMDGFHLDNAILDKLELRHRKGAENTFDSEGFVKMINTLHSSIDPINIPLFDRHSDATIPNAKVITFKHRILIIEGNYLLLSLKPWSELQSTYDYKVLLSPDIEIIKKRLTKRWMDNGYDLDGAKSRALSNDIPNAEFVLNHSVNADFIIE